MKEYGVHPAVITGFWALESDFGAGMGKLPIMRSLVTLAYDCRRGPMFRDELKAALQIIDRGDMTPETMIGSWAGEIGQTQFLPGPWSSETLAPLSLLPTSSNCIGSSGLRLKIEHALTRRASSGDSAITSFPIA